VKSGRIFGRNRIQPDVRYIPVLFHFLCGRFGSAIVCAHNNIVVCTYYFVAMVIAILTVLPHDDRRSVEGNRLIIRAVNPNDAGVLQCSADNEHGAILANAVLTVAGTTFCVLCVTHLI